MSETPQILDREITMLLAIPFNRSIAFDATLDEKLMKERWLQLGIFAKTDGADRKSVV